MRRVMVRCRLLLQSGCGGGQGRQSQYVHQHQHQQLNHEQLDPESSAAGVVEQNGMEGGPGCHHSGFQPLQDDGHSGGVDMTSVDRRPAIGASSEPQHHASDEEKAALEDFLRLFRTQRKCASVNGAYVLLNDRTKDFIWSHAVGAPDTL